MDPKTHSNRSANDGAEAKPTRSEKIVVNIKPVTGWLNPLELREVWRYRELVAFLLLREIKGTYRQMAIGPLWMVISPILGMLLYTIIFNKIAGLQGEGGVPYALFNYSALIPWTFFTSTCMGTANSLLNGKGIISKVYFPRMILPLVSVYSALVEFTVSFVILLLLMAYFGFVPSYTALLAPLYLFLAAAVALALGLFLASWVVHFRDTANVLTYGLLGWMYASPVVYPITRVPESYRDLYRLNPMTNVIQGFRWSLLGVGDPPGTMLLISTLLVIPCLVLGAYAYRRGERTIVDIA